MAKQDMFDLAIYNDFINSLITLNEKVEDMDKIGKVLDLKINNMIKHFEFLEEELRIAEKYLHLVLKEQLNYY